MRGYVDSHPVDLTPAFRADGRRKPAAITSASFSVPLRAEDIVSILYHCKLGTERLSDADRVREAIAEALLNRGAERIARDKARLSAAVNTGGQYDRQRLDAIRQRVSSLFQRAPRSRKAA